MALRGMLCPAVSVSPDAAGDSGDCMRDWSSHFRVSAFYPNHNQSFIIGMDAGLCFYWAIGSPAVFPEGGEPMKKILCLLLCLILLLFTGCLDSVPLGKRAVVRTVGLDYENGEYTAALQLYGQSDSPGGPEIITAKGDTLAGLFSNAAIQQGKQLFLGNLRLILFGASLSAEGIEDVLGFLNEYHQISPATQTAVVLGKAGELMKPEEEKPLPGELLDTLSNAQQGGRAPLCRLMDLIPEQADHAAPVLALAEGPAAIAAGSVIFSEGKVESYLDPEATRGLCWLQGEIGGAVLETKSPVSAAVTRKVSHKISPEAAACFIQLHVSSSLWEGPQDTGLYPAIAREQERMIQQEIEAFLDRTLRQGLDPFDWGSRMGQANLAEAQYQLSVQCQIEEQGAAS